MRSVLSCIGHRILLLLLVKEDEMGCACRMLGSDAYRLIVGKHYGKRPVCRGGLGLEGNIKMDHQKRGWEGKE